jgi:post-segregation antitoxin (ccd killing protein)
LTPLRYTYMVRAKGIRILMKTKLTITIDAELIPKAKRYARARGVSLSSVIEDALRELAAGEEPSFADRWRGRFEPASRADERFRALAEKYL